MIICVSLDRQAEFTTYFLTHFDDAWALGDALEDLQILAVIWWRHILGDVSFSTLLHVGA